MLGSALTEAVGLLALMMAFSIYFLKIVTKNSKKCKKEFNLKLF